MDENKVADTAEEKEPLCDDWVTIRKDLEKIWMPLSVEEQKEFNSEKQIDNCRESKSRWVFRQTPHIDNFIQTGQILGKPGHYGVVKEGVGKRANFQGNKFAVKTVSKCKYKRERIIKSFFEDLRNEVRLMWSANLIKHPNIIKVYSVFEDIKNLHIVMEHCSGGELFDRLEDAGVGSKNFDEEKACKIMRQLFVSVHQLHKIGIAHCDLKPENFIFESQEQYSTIKLIDFGMAKVVRWRQYHTRVRGTPYYIAPEVLKGHYNESCDIWSLGVIMFIIIFGFPPFFDDTNNPNRREADKVIYRKIKNGFEPKVMRGCGAWFPKNQPVSKPCKDLLSRLLRMSTGDRLTCEEALSHPWLSGKDAVGKLTALDPAIRKSMQYFRRNCQLQSEILLMLQRCSFLSRSQSKAVNDAFKEMDLNDDGMVTLEELYSSLHKVDPNVTMEDCNTIMLSVDANNNGAMDYEELLSSRINRKLTSKEERLRKVFKCLDIDDSMTLTVEEIKGAVLSVNENITTEKCKQLIDEADTNKDGVIDYEEWLKVFL